jgi:hypothetical protein
LSEIKKNIDWYSFLLFFIFFSSFF